MTCFSISAFFGHGFFLTGSANQKTKNGGGESGLRVNFNYLSLILIIMNIGDDTWCTIFLSMFLPIWGDGFHAVECDRCDGYGGV